jgi:glycerol-3-phosphate dehydrogenase
MVGEAVKMIPALETVRYIRAFAGVRPLIGSRTASDDRSVSRSFALMDHTEDGLENFVSISGGKLTTYRLMAEKTADLVCDHLGISKPCLTRTEPLPETQPGKWTQPGLAPKLWMQKHEPEDILLCECEMVPKSAVDSIVDAIRKQDGQPDLSQKAQWIPLLTLFASKTANRILRPSPCAAESAKVPARVRFAVFA